MDTTSTARSSLPEVRDCTRCDGKQHLIAVHHGMGKYRCETCQLVVGFDLDTEPPEFLIDRGQPGAYTRDVFGPTLSAAERRL